MGLAAPSAAASSAARATSPADLVGLPVAAILLAARNAVATEASVHVEARGTERVGSAVVRVRLSLDAGRTRAAGREVVRAGRTVAIASIRLTGRTGYCTGNAAGLVASCGLSVAQATAAGRRWVVLPRSSGAYRTLAQELLMRHQIDAILPRDPAGLVVSGTARISGQQTVVVEGTAPPAFGAHALLTLYVAASGPALVVRAVVVVPLGNRVAETLTRWGAAVVVAAPAGAVRLATLR